VSVDIHESVPQSDVESSNAPKWWQLAIVVAVAIAVVCGIGYGVVVAVKAMNRTSAEANYNSMHAAGVNSQEREAINAQAATNPAVKAALDNGYVAVNFTWIRDSYTVVFKQCGNASFTDCAERTHPTGKAMWVRVAMDKPSDVRNPATFHLRNKADFVYEYPGHSASMLVCMPQTEDWTLSTDTFGIGAKIGDTFRGLTYDYGNDFSQRKMVDTDEVYCTTMVRL
jgi:hypothetical protein